MDVHLKKFLKNADKLNIFLLYTEKIIVIILLFISKFERSVFLRKI